MFCEQCGAKIEENKRFCSICEEKNTIIIEIPKSDIISINGIIINKNRNKIKYNVETDNRKNKMYIIIKETPLKFGSSVLTETLKTLNVGTNVKFISENISGWYCIETLDGERGFCKSSDLDLI